MKKILENLKMYFNNNSKEKIENDCAEHGKHNENGVKIDEKTCRITLVDGTVLSHKIKDHEKIIEMLENKFLHLYDCEKGMLISISVDKILYVYIK